MANNGWIDIRLSDASSKIGSGATPRGGASVYLDDGEIALIRSQNVYNDGFHHEGLAYITEEHAEQLSNVEVQPGDVLLNITGHSVARCCQVDPSILPARVNQHVSIIRPDPNRLDARFLRYFLVSPQMQELMLSWASAGGTRKALTKEMIESFQILAPEGVIEQQSIACILGTLDDKIELNRRTNQALEGIAQAVFTSWFVNFDPVQAKVAGQQPSSLALHLVDLFPDTFEESKLGKIPKGWEVHALPDIFDINPPRQLSRRTSAPYLAMSDMPTQGHAPDSWIEREVGSGMKFKNGDTLVARITPCLENGKTAYVDFLGGGEVGWGSTEYIVLRPREPVPTIFAYLLARNNEFRAFAVQQMTGSSGRQRVPADSLTQYEIVVPAVDSPVFTAFGQAVNPLFERIRSAMGQSRTLAALRDTLLPRLISGELRVPDAERIVERCT
jgi:type I restriction enzyme S subunit